MSNDSCSKESCGTGSSSASSSCDAGKCPCGGDCGGDPMACAKALWCSSFAVALKQVHVDALKARIVKAWGPNIDKGADAVVEAMGTVWMSKMAEAKAKGDLGAKMAAIMFGGK
ncbi:MAG: hypothetical protein K8T20_12055 [Planctomycetes bacterium]|nr:hypothetical protein [Planctomycetota bacterium]